MDSHLRDSLNTVASYVVFGSYLFFVMCSGIFMLAGDILREMPDHRLLGWITKAIGVLFLISSAYILGKHYYKKIEVFKEKKDGQQSTVKV